MDINVKLPGNRQFKRFFFVDFENLSSVKSIADNDKNGLIGADKLKKSDCVPAYYCGSQPTSQYDIRLLNQMFDSRAHYYFIPNFVEMNNAVDAFICQDILEVSENNPEAEYYVITGNVRDYEKTIRRYQQKGIKVSIAPSIAKALELESDSASKSNVLSNENDTGYTLEGLDQKTINKLIPVHTGYSRFFFYKIDDSFSNGMKVFGKIKKSDCVPCIFNANLKTIKISIELLDKMLGSRAHYVFIPAKDEDSINDVMRYCIEIIKKTNPEAKFYVEYIEQAVRTYFGQHFKQQIYIDHKEEIIALMIKHYKDEAVFREEVTKIYGLNQAAVDTICNKCKQLFEKLQ